MSTEMHFGYREFITHPLRLCCMFKLLSVFFPLCPHSCCSPPHHPPSLSSSNGLSPVDGINKLLHPCVPRLSEDCLNINSSFASVVQDSYTYIYNYFAFFPPFFTFVSVERRRKPEIGLTRKSPPPVQLGRTRGTCVIWACSSSKERRNTDAVDNRVVWESLAAPLL